MTSAENFDQFAPQFEPHEYSADDQRLIGAFFTNLDKPVYVPLIFAPELIGALSSRASRAPEDLRKIFLDEYICPFVYPERDSKETDAQWQERARYGQELKGFISFLAEHPITDIFSNPRARQFYIKWLAQYGDDSIAQMAGAHLVYSGLSQVAIKHLEDQRIGLAPIEKSTRYVNYGEKINGQYLYYTDPTLRILGLETEYRAAMDGLFDAYALLIPKFAAWLKEKFSGEKSGVIEKKAFDTLRGLLPVATLSQVAFFGNGQAFEYMISRSLRHPLGEIRWAAESAYEELTKIIPAFLRRIKDPERQEQIAAYQTYLAQKGIRTAPFAVDMRGTPSQTEHKKVRLVEYDPDGEEKIIAGILFTADNTDAPWDVCLRHARAMNATEKRAALDAYLAGRTARWQKVGRAFENVFVRFDITMNIGAWRDLHRHRMHTQIRQFFTCRHGYDVPPEIIDAGLESEYRNAILRAEDVYARIAEEDPRLAQYTVTLAHRVRFMQWQNLRECFWEMELRTIPEGHPDYRHIEIEKFRLLERVYPLIAERMMVNTGEYDFARRGQEEKIQEKLRRMEGVV